MKALALVLATAAMACMASSDPYPIFASAELAPLTQEITGHFDVLGTGEVRPQPYTEHRLAGYHVHLPDAQPRRVLLYATNSCATPRMNATMAWDLGQIRRVDDQAHFFVTDVVVGDQRVDVDVVTQWLFIHNDPTVESYYAGDLIAVVQDVVDGVRDEIGPVSAASVDASGGQWLACGPFRISD